jgi:HrpA-like RNA helicase
VNRPEHRCVDDVVTIVAMISAENIWEDKSEYHRQQQFKRRREGNNNHKDSHAGEKRGRSEIDEDYLASHALEDAHSKLYHRLGDHFTFLTIYQKWEEAGMLVDSSCCRPFFKVLFLYRLLIRMVLI